MPKTPEEIIGLDYAASYAACAAIDRELADAILRSDILLAALYPDDDELARDIAAIPSLVWC